MQLQKQFTDSIYKQTEIYTLTYSLINMKLYGANTENILKLLKIEI